jgi:hypothetical protein
MEMMYNHNLALQIIKEEQNMMSTIQEKVQYVNNPTLQKLYNQLKLNIGKNIIVEWVVDGQVMKSVNYSVPTTFSSWFK